MNAKFKKWLLGRRPNDDYDTCYLAMEAWQAAIQSLEVTPELIAIGFTAFNNEWNAYKTLHENRLAQMTAALYAVLSALKEHAK